MGIPSDSVKIRKNESSYEKGFYQNNFYLNLKKKNYKGLIIIFKN